MPKDDILMRIGKAVADNDHIREDVEKIDGRVEALEKKDRALDLAIAKCTAIWGFILLIGGSVGSFIAYNFEKVRLAVVAAFHAFNQNGN